MFFYSTVNVIPTDRGEDGTDVLDPTHCLYSHAELSHSDSIVDMSQMCTFKHDPLGFSRVKGQTVLSDEPVGHFYQALQSCDSSTTDKSIIGISIHTI